MIRLHHCPQTRSMRSLWLLNELKVGFEIVEWPFDKTLRSFEYLALNPAGRVPALELDGQLIWETGAIAETLCERFSPEELGRPPGHAERVEWLIWVHFAETISQHTATLTQQHVVLYNDSMRSPIVMKLEAKRIEKCFGAIEAQLSDGRSHLLKGGFSAADVAVGQAVYMARHFTRHDTMPLLTAWYDRITAREGFIRSLPADTKLYARDFYEAWDA